jgi:alpha-tubulin suppressor-like RCC1 family protein
MVEIERTRWKRARRLGAAAAVTTVVAGAVTAAHAIRGYETCGGDLVAVPIAEVPPGWARLPPLAQEALGDTLRPSNREYARRWYGVRLGPFELQYTDARLSYSRLHHTEIADPYLCPDARLGLDDLRITDLIKDDPVTLTLDRASGIHVVSQKGRVLGAFRRSPVPRALRASPWRRSAELLCLAFAAVAALFGLARLRRAGLFFGRGGLASWREAQIAEGGVLELADGSIHLSAPPGAAPGPALVSGPEAVGERRFRRFPLVSPARAAARGAWDYREVPGVGAVRVASGFMGAFADAAASQASQAAHAFGVALAAGASALVVPAIIALEVREPAPFYPPPESTEPWRPLSVVEIAAGDDHTCARLDNGAVRCWGDGGDGRLGRGDTRTVGLGYPPAIAGDADLGGRARSLAAGGAHTCAILDEGRVRCWGRGDEGQLGYGELQNVGDAAPPSASADVPLPVRAVQLTAGSTQTCAVLEDHNLRCWGRALFIGTGGATALTALPEDIDNSHRIAQFDVGEHHLCGALVDGRVTCWGQQSEGELGFPPTNGEPRELPEVNVGAKVKALALGQLHTCALLEDGRVRCWGYSGNGQLGYGNWRSIGDAAEAGDVDVGGKVIQLAAGGRHTCALLEGGGVRCWGRNDFGQLGYGNRRTVGATWVPAAVGDVRVGGRVVQLAAGKSHTCALLEGGRVRCWGRGDQGQLGYGSKHNVGDRQLPWEAGDVPIL